MKRTGKFVAYLLVLTLIMGLFTGLGYVKAPEEAAKAADATFKVLEIVPDLNMQTFFYFVDLSKNPTADPMICGKSIATNCAVPAFNSYLKNTGCGELKSGSFESKDFFVNYVLKEANSSDTRKVEVIARTPSMLKTDPSVINSADFIIINQTVPAALLVDKSDTSSQKKTFDDDPFDSDTVLRIFKKVAGVDTDPVPYIIDYTLYNGESFYDVREKNEGSNYSKRFGYIAADNVHELFEGATGNNAQTFDSSKNMFPNVGTDSNSYKLFKLLSCLDPATLYGLYFTDTDGSYGIDEDLNLIYMKAGEDNNIPLAYNLYGKAAAWTDDYFRPNYMSTLSAPIREDNFATHSILTAMGWNEIDTVDTAQGSKRVKKVADFCTKIGGSSGRGYVYKSSKGLFYIMKSSKVTLSATPTVSWVPTSKLSFDTSETGYVGEEGGSNAAYKIKFKVIGEKNSVEGFRIVLNNVEGVKTSSTGNWKGTTAKANTTDTADNILYIESTDGNDQKLANGHATCSDFKISYSSPLTKAQVQTALSSMVIEEKSVFDPSSGANYADQLAVMIGSFANPGSKNDYHPYRFLVVTDNATDSSVNRSVIARMVGAANTQGKGLVGGIVVDCISKHQFENLALDLNQSYDAICIGCTLTSVGNSKLSTFTTGNVLKSSDSKFTANDLVSEFSSNLLGKRFGIDYRTLPKEYYVNYKASYVEMNGWDHYSADGLDLSVANHLNFINDDFNTGKTTLDFDFTVKGSGTYDIDLYVDSDFDGKFENNKYEKKNLKESHAGNTPFTDQVNLKQFLGENFVGGFSWKIVITDTSTKKSISRVGYSAIHNEGKINKIKILQIYPTDYSSKYGADEHLGYDNSEGMSSNPMLLLPTKDEISIAKTGKNLAGETILSHGRGDISTKTWSGTGEASLQGYFSGVMKIDTVKNLASGGSTRYDKFDDDDDFEDANINKNETLILPSVVVDSDGAATTEGKRGDILRNSAIFYQFLSKLDDYDIDVTRYSVYGFSQAYKSGKIAYDPETGKLSAAGSEPIKNLNGSNRYGYGRTDLGLDEDWETETVVWTEGTLKKYLVDPTRNLIYGERETADGKYKYYGSEENSHPGTLITGGASKDDQFDIVMLGFGSNMDYMLPDAKNLLVRYLENGGPAFVGNGAVTKSSNNNLGAAIRNIIGMTDTPVADYLPNDSENQLMMVTNDTLFSHYPYRINKYMKNSDGTTQPYALDLSGDNPPVVSFVRYKTGSSVKAAYQKWGNAKETYYLYRKDNITFCGFGNTFRAGQDSKVGAIMSMAETLMIVNALISASRAGSSSKTSDPYLKIIDKDSDYIDEDALEDDYEIHFYKESAYTSYDSVSIAKFSSDASKTSFNEPMLGIKDASTEFAKEYSETAGDIMIEDEKFDGFLDVTVQDGKTLITRWVPYRLRVSTIEGGYIEFFTSSGLKINLDVKKFEFSETSNKYRFVNVTPDSSKKYTLDEKTVYYIGIPLSQDDPHYNIVTSGTKPGFNIQKTGTDLTGSSSTNQFAITMKLSDAGDRPIEKHSMMMIRRVVYIDN